MDLTADRFELHSDPGPNGYRKTAHYRRGARGESTTLPGLAFAVDEVLPPREPEPKS